METIADVRLQAAPALEHALVEIVQESRAVVLEKLAKVVAGIVLCGRNRVLLVAGEVGHPCQRLAGRKLEELAEVKTPTNSKPRLGFERTGRIERIGAVGFREAAEEVVR